MQKLVWLGICLALIGCKGGDGDKKPFTPPAPISNGVYQVCEYDSDSNVSFKTYVFLDDYFVSENITYYDHANCQSGNEIMSDRFVYSYSRRGDSFSLAVEAYNSTSLSASDVSWNNTNNYCGINNWVLNVPRNIMGLNCGGETVNVNDPVEITASRSGNNITVTSMNTGMTTMYGPLGGWDFTNQSQTATTGNYVYFIEDIGIHMNLDGAGNYTISYYDPATLKYYTENGTYTSANNELNFTVGTYIPDCGTDEGTTESLAISKTIKSLAINRLGQESFLFETVSYSAVQFKNAYLNGSYTAGCF